MHARRATATHAKMRASNGVFVARNKRSSGAIFAKNMLLVILE